ncbi:MAG TPA: hypothetical protein VHR85_01850 [Nocardioides sp.]|jgi:hypothetical protein|nr:hypothetical protein [Nocardioides sp.]
MTVTANLVWFLAMAVATTTLLVVGTLTAADIIHFRRPRKPAERPNPRGR